jgi:hypothetical protein
MANDLKRLTKARRQKAIDAAAQHEELRDLLGRKHRIVFVEPNLSGRGEQSGSDRAVVGIYDYENNRSVVALVDPSAGDVLQVDETPARFQLSADERDQAEALAGKDDRVRDFLGKRRMNPLTRLYFPPDGADHDPDHRYAIVFLRPSNAERRYAVVDLSTEEVADVLESLTASRPGGH